MVEYKNGKIYKIENDINDKIYVGSTCLKRVCQRMSLHRYKAKSRQSKFYIAMRKIGIKHFKIVLLKLFPCNSMKELEAEEYAMMTKYKCKGISLYNSVVDGTMPIESINKRAKARFRRGCVSHAKNKDVWKFEWYSIDGKHNKSFASKKWGGSDKARQKCEDLRNTIFPL